MECGNCGFEVFDPSGGVCPKCSQDPYMKETSGTYSIDIAHHGESWVDAKEIIDSGLDHVIRNNILSFRIIHGMGQDHGHSSVIKDRALPYLHKLAAQHQGKLRPDGDNRVAHLLIFD